MIIVTLEKPIKVTSEKDQQYEGRFFRGDLRMNADAAIWILMSCEMLIHNSWKPVHGGQIQFPMHNLLGLSQDADEPAKKLIV